MKKVVLMAVGAAVLLQVAKKYGINSFGELKNKITKFVEDLNLKEWVNVDTLKNMVAPQPEAMTTA